MIPWTDAARASLEQHLRAHRADFVASGADPHEVAADIRRHVEEELSVAKITVATREDVERILGRLRPLAASAPDPSPATRLAPRWPWSRSLWVVGLSLCGLAFIFGIFHRLSRSTEAPAILPVATVVQMALQGGVRPGSGRISFRRSGETLATISGESIDELDNGRGRKVHLFRAEGPLSYDQLSILIEHRFREDPAAP